MILSCRNHRHRGCFCLWHFLHIVASVKPLLPTAEQKKGFVFFIMCARTMTRMWKYRFNGSKSLSKLKFWLTAYFFFFQNNSTENSQQQNYLQYKYICNWMFFWSMSQFASFCVCICVVHWKTECTNTFKFHFRAHYFHQIEFDYTFICLPFSCIHQIFIVQVFHVCITHFLVFKSFSAGRSVRKNGVFLSCTHRKLFSSFYI